MKLHVAIEYYLSQMPEDTRNAVESLVFYICVERKAHTVTEQLAILRLAIVMHQELVLENIRFSQPDNVSLAAAKHVFCLLDHGEQMQTQEMNVDIHNKALRYLKDNAFKKETHERLSDAGLPPDAIEREIARQCLELALPIERVSASLANRCRSALRSLSDAHKLSKL